MFQEAGIKVFHVVPTLDMALKALDAGVDGLVVEGGEGGGFKNPRPVSTMVLLPLIRERTDVPIIAAGGICDGPTMAAAFAMGAEGVQMGTAMLSCADSPVHNNWKQSVYDAKETDTVFLNQQGRPALRAMRTNGPPSLNCWVSFNPSSICRIFWISTLVVTWKQRSRSRVRLLVESTRCEVPKIFSNPRWLDFMIVLQA